MKTVRLATVVGFLVTVSVPVPARAGIVDSPLPTPFKNLLYSVPGVINNGFLGTEFACTSTASSSIMVAVEVFGNSGGAPLNDASTTSLTVAPGQTVLIGTTDAFALGEDKSLGVTLFGKGSARIISTSKSLICTAFLTDIANSPPAVMNALTIVAKTKQKAAN